MVINFVAPLEGELRSNLRGFSLHPLSYLKLALVYSINDISISGLIWYWQLNFNRYTHACSHTCIYLLGCILVSDGVIRFRGQVEVTGATGSS